MLQMLISILFIVMIGILLINILLGAKQRTKEVTMEQQQLSNEEKEKVLQELVQEEKYVEAVRQARMLYGYSLVEAKRHVDELKNDPV